MTTPEKSTHRRAPVRAAAAVLAGLALAGCAATNVGDSWQCPLAQGKVCASVAAADPAVPDVESARGVGRQEPLYLAPTRGDGEQSDVPPVSGPACEAGCGEFLPFAWLGRLLGAEAERDGGAREEPSSAAETGLPGESAAGSLPAAEPRPGDAAPESPAAAASVSLDDRAAGTSALPAPAEPAGADLRTGEVIARIWIAPFVDADGVYREASHVRAVLEPAGWRMP